MANKESERFAVKYEQGGFVNPGFKVIIDKETGVNYLIYTSGYQGGITPLLDATGKVVVTSVYDE